MCCSYSKAQIPGAVQSGNIMIGNSASGLPIFKTTENTILYPVPSKTNANSVEWVEILDFLQGAVIIGADESSLPIFQLGNGDVVYLYKKDIELEPTQNNILPMLSASQIQQQVQNELKMNGNQMEQQQQEQQQQETRQRDPSKLDFGRGVKLSETCYVPEGRTGCAPHFIISGAMKSGSTSLFSYLQNHPNILPLVDNPILDGKPVLAEKEVRFFNDPTFGNFIVRFGEKDALSRYLDVFRPITASSHLITGESSPMYICQPDVAKRIDKALPFIKNIILLRNPIDRLYSEHWFKLSLAPQNSGQDVHSSIFEVCTLQEMAIYNYCNISSLIGDIDSISYDEMYYKVRRLSPTHYDCISGGKYEGMCRPDIPVGIGCNVLGIRNSLYVLQLKEWVEVFNEDRLKIIPSEAFYEDPATILSEVIHFLKIREEEEFDWSFIGAKAYNIVSGRGPGLSIGGQTSESLSDKYPPMDPRFRKELESYFSPFNQMLAELLKRPNFWDY